MDGKNFSSAEKGGERHYFKHKRFIFYYDLVSLSISLLKICPFIGKIKTGEYVLPILALLVKDESYDVRVNIISSIDSLCKVVK